MQIAVSIVDVFSEVDAVRFIAQKYDTKIPHIILCEKAMDLAKRIARNGGLNLIEDSNLEELKETLRNLLQK